MLANHRKDKRRVLQWLGLTFLLGLGFIAMELNEFHQLIAEGAGPQRSALLTGFFTRVGTHGLHVLIGLVWMALLMIQVQQRGLCCVSSTRLSC